MEYKGYKLRHEHKFYINAFVYHELRERFRHVLQADSHMKDQEGYLISSLYFDDMYHSALEDKINGAPFREKYRIRLYNHDDAFIKLECKIKFNEYISKQAVPISRDEYDRILNGEYEYLISRPEEVCRKLYGYQKTRLLKPVTVVEYMREAYVHPLGNVRITFDKNLSASYGNLDVFHLDYETIQVPMEEMMIMEVKYDNYIPDYIWKIIQTEPMAKCAISKYVLCRDINRKVRIL
ncbi:MAG: polyphosphate polymerase domain-containing protein [Anaerolineaceae bacterium]|nr:MAG: polyphosphate polymerase domain-containing protein [Anaerolineaceae bacterium]